MKVAAPEPGFVIRYSYPWHAEFAAGREEGTKDRPCAVVLAQTSRLGAQWVTVLPVTHAPPKDRAAAIEIPAEVKRRLRLDDERSWIVLNEANRFKWPGLAELRERMARFALSLHPEKTRLIKFGRRAALECERRGQGKLETFAFLGFTHICGTSRRGDFQLRRKTRRDRMRAKLDAIKQELRRHLHASIPEQGSWLRRVVTGYFAYHAVPTNAAALSAFRYFVSQLWLRSLRQRSQRSAITWRLMAKLEAQWLPKPRILHPWPSKRFAVKHPRWEPYASIGLVRI